MNSNLVYLFYVVPLIFGVFSIKYKFRFERMAGTGKIPYIIDAKQRQHLFMFLAVLSALLILVTTQYQFLCN